jgi:glycerophosphoryl diester phosphodiesterase
MNKPLVIAHRGASGHLPEHTLAGYALAMLQGADFIEPDLVATRDGVLVARHENEIGGTTDVAAHDEFAARRRTQLVDGVPVAGWFTEDFTLEELRTLRARERLPALRPGNARHDGEFGIPTFDEILSLLSQVNAARRGQGLPLVGVYPETKHPSHFAGLGLALEAPLLAALEAHGDGAPVFIQSFEMANLEALRVRCAQPLVQLMQVEGGPWDRAGSGRFESYAQLATPAGLREVARYANVIGVQKEMVMGVDAAGRAVPTDLVRHAHEAGLAVHAWTFRAENHFLPPPLRRGEKAAGHGDLAAEVQMFAAAGIDGVFSDFPGLACEALAGAGVTKP